jgi:hypothetical protein
MTSKSVVQVARAIDIGSGRTFLYRGKTSFLNCTENYESKFGCHCQFEICVYFPSFFDLTIGEDTHIVQFAIVAPPAKV